MWKVPVSIDKFGPISYPNICPLSPKRGQAFSESHCAKAYKLGVPAGLRDFYKYCGVTGADMNSGLFLNISLNRPLDPSN
jgi:hypothetical protein